MHAPFGSFPGEMAYIYGRDEAGIKEWVDRSATPEGARDYLQKYIFDLQDHQAYLDLIGKERLEQAVQDRERRE